MSFDIRMEDGGNAGQVAETREKQVHIKRFVFNAVATTTTPCLDFSLATSRRRLSARSFRICGLCPVYPAFISRFQFRGIFYNVFSKARTYHQPRQPHRTTKT